MKFYFCNFLNGGELSRKNAGLCKIKSVDLVGDFTSSSVQEVEAFKLKDENGTKLIFSDSYVKGAERFDIFAGVSEEDLGTPENPLIAVATKGAMFAVGISSHVKYMTIKGGLIILLVKGSIKVYDGEKYVELSRNLLDEDYGKIQGYSGDNIDELNMFSDPVTGIVYKDFVVNDISVTITPDKEGFLKKSLKLCVESSVFLDNEIFEKKRQAIEAEKVRREQAEADKKARNEAYYKQKSLEEETPKVAPKKPKATSSAPKENVNFGAKDFLGVVARYKSQEA